MTQRREVPADIAAQRAAFVAELSQLMDLKGLTHRDLGRALGCSHAVVSGWRRGAHQPPAQTVFKVERFLEVPPGSLSRHLGYLPPEARTGTFPAEAFETAVDADPLLDDRAKRMLKSAYAELKAQPKPLAGPALPW